MRLNTTFLPIEVLVLVLVFGVFGYMWDMVFHTTHFSIHCVGVLRDVRIPVVKKLVERVLYPPASPRGTHHPRASRRPPCLYGSFVSVIANAVSYHIRSHPFPFWYFLGTERALGGSAPFISSIQSCSYACTQAGGVLYSGSCISGSSYQ